MFGRTAPLPNWVFSLPISTCNNPFEEYLRKAKTLKINSNLKEPIKCGVGDVGVAPEHLRLHHQPGLRQEPKPGTISDMIRFSF